MYDAMTDLFLSTIEEMIVRSAQRYVEARRLIKDIPPSIRREATKEIAAQKRAIDRLVKFRTSLVTERAPSPRPAVTNPLLAIALPTCAPTPRKRRRSAASTTRTRARKPSLTTSLSA